MAESLIEHDQVLSARQPNPLQQGTPARIAADAPFADQTSPAKVTAASRGDVYTTNAKVHLYFPPRAFREDAVVIVTSVARVP